MANYSSLLYFGLGFLLLFHSCFAQIEQVTESRSPNQGRSQCLRTECQIRNLDALEPKHRIQSEAGITEFWDQDDQQLRCANVAVLRQTIQERGLLVPSYTNGPELVYVVEGRGIHGAVFPGCAETFQSAQSQSQSQFPRRPLDQHQKISEIQEGDVIALPTGVSHWFYNDGQSPLVLVALVDVGNSDNQLDQYFRKFYLGGSPQEEIQGYSRSQSEGSRHPFPGRSGNIFSGFDERILADAFNVSPELIRRLQRQESKKGIIIRVQDDLRVLSPRTQEREYEEREQYGGCSDNGLEQTICTMKLKYNVNKPSRADVFNPRGGRVTSVNGLDLPVLRALQLSAERGVLKRNAILAPHWNVISHSIVYIIRGSGRIQIVSERGENVFNDQVQAGQLIVVPQNFAVVKRASNRGLEWISFKTNAYATTNQLAGMNSVFRGLPEEVIANSYQVSREDARRLKNNRQELTVFSPGSSSQFDLKM